MEAAAGQGASQLQEVEQAVRDKGQGATQLQEVHQAVREEHARLREWLAQWAREQQALLEKHTQLPQPALPLPLRARVAGANPEPPEKALSAQQTSHWRRSCEPSPEDTSNCSVGPQIPEVEPQVPERVDASPPRKAGASPEAQTCEGVARSKPKLNWEGYEEEMAVQRQIVQRMLTNMDGERPARRSPVHALKRFTGALTKLLPTKAPDNILMRVVTSSAFDGLILLLIILNTVFMGVEADRGVKAALEDPPRSPPAFFHTVNLAFATCFLVELVLRLAAMRLWFLAAADRAWNIFDAFLVALSIVQLVLEGSGVGFLRIARMLRLVRVGRIFRVAKVFGELRELVHAMMNAVAALAWSLTLLLMIMYTFAIIFLQATQGCLADGSCSRAETRVWYPDLPWTMYTLFWAISGGDWGVMAAPLTNSNGIYALMWAAYLVLTMFSMLNLLTGVFVAVSSEVQSHASQIRQKISAEENFVRDMKDLFVMLDSGKTGMLTREELSNSVQNDYVVAFLENTGLTITDFHTLFDLLDYNHSGYVSIVDFIAGCARLRGNAKSMYLQKLLLQVAGLERSLEELQGQLGSLTRSVHPSRKPHLGLPGR